VCGCVRDSLQKLFDLSKILIEKVEKNIFYFFLLKCFAVIRKRFSFAPMFHTNQKNNMYLVKFTNGKFLGLSMSYNLVYAHNMNFAYTFDSIEKIEKTARFRFHELNETFYTITDLSGNPVKTFNPSII
jgi:hypothetical protein